MTRRPFLNKVLDLKKPKSKNMQDHLVVATIVLGAFILHIFVGAGPQFHTNLWCKRVSRKPMGRGPSEDL